MSIEEEIGDGAEMTLSHPKPESDKTTHSQSCRLRNRRSAKVSAIERRGVGNSETGSNREEGAMVCVKR